MPVDTFSNNYATTLSADITATAMSFAVASGTGAPTGQCRLLVTDWTNSEIMTVTIAGTTVTVIQRASEPTAGTQTAYAFAAASSNVYHVITAAALGNLGAMSLIASSVVSGTATAKVVFTNIPQTYTNLRLMIAGRSLYASANNDEFYLRLNTGAATTSDTGANYNQSRMQQESGSQYDQGTAASNGGTATLGYCPSASDAADYIGICAVDLPSYTNTAIYKTYMTLFASYLGAGTAQSDNGTYGGYWTNLGAITLIEVGCLAGNLAAGTTVSLYGLP